MATLVRTIFNDKYLFHSSWNSTSSGEPLLTSPLNISYTILQAVPGYYGDGIPVYEGLAQTYLYGRPSNFSAMIASQATQVRRALDALASVAGISVSEIMQTSETDRTTPVGNITIGFESRLLKLGEGWIDVSTEGDIATGNFPRFTFSPIAARQALPESINGDVWIYSPSYRFSQFAPGSRAFFTLLHELGHSLGLAHDGRTAGTGTTSAASLPTYQASALFTVMAYPQNQSSEITPTNLYPITPMVYDIAQLQRLYGKNTTTNTGATLYTFADNSHPFADSLGMDAASTYRNPGKVLMTLWDADGSDEINASGMSTKVLIDLMPGSMSSIGLNNFDQRNVGIALECDIENATGGGAGDILYGNKLANRLIGNGGDDTLEGGIGNDLLEGGAGKDTYTFTKGDGADTIEDLDGGIIAGLSLPRGSEVIVADKKWQSADKTVTYEKIGNGLKDLKITFQNNDNDSITINNFDFASATGATAGAETVNTSGDNTKTFGITLAQDPKLVLSPTATPSTNLARLADYADQTVATVAEGAAQAFTAFVANTSPVGRVLTLALGSLWSLYTLYIDGKAVKPTGANIDLDLAAGADSLTFTLAATGDVDATTQFDLAATLTDPNAPEGSTPLTDSVAVNVEAKTETEGDYAAIIVGDFNPIDFDPGLPGLQAHSDALDNRLTDGEAPGYDDQLYDSLGNDLLQGKDGNDILSAWRGGDDVLEGGNGQDILYGGAGDDQVFADTQVNRADALAANLASSGASSAKGDWVDGAAGDDLLNGAADADVLLGGAGADMLLGQAGNDTLWGDMSGTQIKIDWTLNRIVAPSGDITHYRPEFANASASTLQSGNDMLLGGGGDDWIFGEGGDDFIDGGVDNDVAFGDQGNDQINGGDGNDVLSGDNPDEGANGGSLAGDLHGNDVIDGGAGNDQLTGNGGNDDLWGGDGDDEIDGDDTKTPGQFHGTDYLDGEAGNDKLWGGGNDDELFGGAGNDILEGDYSALDKAFHGDDYLDGEAGDDTLFGDGGKDTLVGGEGKDWLGGGAGDDLLFGGKGDDSLQGDEGKSDQGGDDILDGGVGKDVLAGNGGNDELRGGDGDDSLSGEDGNDTLIGGGGADAMAGGKGDDIYVLRAGDGPSAANGNAEVIFEERGNDTVRIEGAGSIAVQAANGGGDLVIDYGNGDRLHVVGGIGGAIERYEIDDKTLSIAELIGKYSTDTLTGSDADGVTWTLGGSGDNTISARGKVSGGKGNDTLSASGNNNQIMYSLGDGTDHVTTGGVGNTLVLGSGVTANDVKLSLGSLAIQIGPDAGDVIHFENFDPADPFTNKPFDSIQFDDGSTMSYEELLDRGFDLVGTDQNDMIIGTAVADRVIAGAGDDLVAGNTGDDTYIYRLGDGSDTIYDEGGFDSLVLQGVTLAELVLEKNYHDLTIHFPDGGCLVLPGFVDKADNGIEALYFDDGSAVDAQALIDGATFVAPEGSSFDLVDGEDATYYGSEGDDTYFFGPGSGQDVIVEAQGFNDRISIDANPSQLRVTRDASNLILLLDTGDRLTVSNFYLADSARIEGIDFADGSAWDQATILAAANTATAGNDWLEGADGDDALAGLEGDDTLIGGAGNDTYTYRLGDGTDSIIDAAGVDTLVLENINGADVVIEKNYHDVTLRMLDGGSIQLVGFVDVPALRLESIVFADGSRMDAQTLLANANFVAPPGASFENTADNEYFLGTEGDDIYHLAPGSGQDLIEEAQGAYDQVWVDAAPSALRVTRDAENLILLLDSGDSVTVLGYYLADGAKIEAIHFNDGTIWDRSVFAPMADAVTTGSDYLVGTVGDDLLDGGEGNDTYSWGPGSGDDTVVESGGGWDQVSIAAAPAQVQVFRTVSDLILVLESGERLTVLDYYVADVAKIEAVVFSDGTSWDQGMIETRLPHPTDGSETLFGTPGGDLMDGLGGDDVLVGGEGDDTYVLRAGSGNDTVVEMTAGDIDTISVDAAPSQLRVTRDAENLILVLDTGERLTVEGYFLNDGAKIEAILFNDGVVWDQSTVASLADAVTAGDDFLAGTEGDDELEGLEGSDTYLLRAGSGNDTVIESAGDGDTVVVDADPTQLRVTRNASDLVLVLDTGECLTVKDYYVTEGAKIEVIRFSDGTTWDKSVFTSLADTPSAGDDYLVGTGGDEQIAGLEGSDTYVLKAGSGNDTIIETAGDEDTIYVDADPSQLRVTRDAENLILVLESGERLTVKDYYVTDGAKIEAVSFSDGTTWDQPTVESMANSATAGDDYLVGTTGDDNLDGGAGNDTLAGGEGDDTYEMYAGAGDDTIVETAGLDVIVVDAPQDQVAVSRTDTDLVLHLGGTDRLTVKNFYTADGARVEGVEFSDGSEWDSATLRIKALGATDGDDAGLIGTMADDLMDGLAGNDTLAGGAGNDTYVLRTGSGMDQIIETSGAADRVFVEGDPSQVRVTRNATSLILLLDSGDRVTVADYFSSDGAKVEFVEFSDGTTWDEAAILDLVATQTEQDDYLVGGSGGDLIAGGYGSDEIHGGAGDDVLFGADQWDRDAYGGEDEGPPLATTDNDVLYGEDGDDVLDGGFRADADTLVGGTGNDTYVFRIGSGADTVTDEEGSNDSIYVEGAPDQLHVGRTPGGDLVLTFTSSPEDCLRVTNFFNSDAAQIESITFSDGAVWDLQTVQTKANTATTGDDYLVGTDGDDEMQGLAGKDYLLGGAGDDTYVYGAGDGVDQVIDGAGANRVLLSPGITAADISVSFYSGELIVVVGRGADRIVFPYWSSGPENRMELAFDDGTVWSPAELESRAALGPTETGDYIQGGSGGDSIDGGGGDDLIYGFDGNDTVSGGKGNDELRAGVDDDVYQYAAGDGTDTIVDDGGVDTLALGAGIAADDIQVAKDAHDVFVTFKGKDEVIRVVGGQDTDSAFIESISFADGTVWDLATIRARSIDKGTVGSDSIVGTSHNDWIDGLGGDDNVSGGAGDDIYVWGRGYGNLHLTDSGSSVGDTLRFKEGVTVADLSFSRLQSSLVIDVAGDGGAQIVIGNRFYDSTNSSSTYAIENFVFADGSALSYTDVDRMVPIVGVATDGANGIYGAGADDTIDGKGGDDRIEGFTGDDVLNGGAGIDKLYGGAGNDLLTGGSNSPSTDSYSDNGYEKTWDSVGDNWYFGGKADYLNGGAGDDTYLIQVGDGYDQVEDASGNDRILLGAGVSAEDIVVTAGNSYHPGTLRIDYTSGQTSSGAVYIPGSLVSSSIERIESMDGDVVLTADLSKYVATTVSGTAASDVITCGVGRQIINAGAGNDVVHAGAGRDSLDGGTDDDILYGDSGNDTITDSSGSNYLSGGDGADSIAGAGVLDGGAGSDRLAPSAGSIVVFGHGYGQDSVSGTAFVIRMNPDVAPADVSVRGQTVPGFVSNLSLILGDGSDQLVGASNATEVQFADGTVWTQADLMARASGIWAATSGADGIAGSPGADLLDGGAGNDVIAGGDGDDTLLGGAGNDRINGNAGDDQIFGGDDSDDLSGNEGNDLLVGGAGADSLNGNDGSDTLDGGADNDTLSGGSGADVYRFGRGYGVDVISDGDVTTVSGAVTVIEMDAGVSPADVVVAWTTSELVLNLGNNDILCLPGWPGRPAGAGNILVRFQDGAEWTESDLLARRGVTFTEESDYVVGSPVNDSLNGGGGSDSLQGLGGADTLVGGDGNDSLSGGEGNDLLVGDAGADSLQGGNGNDTLNGGSGNDTLEGGEGNDILVGNDDNDTLTAGAGDDLLDGGIGNDTLTGGAGNDVYLFGFGSGKDTVYPDGQDGSGDVIQLGAGVGPSDVGLSLFGSNDLVISLGDGNDVLTLTNWQSSSRRISRVRFDDGTEMNLALRPAGPILGTVNNDTINVSPYDDYLYGLGGNDYLNGGAGDDHLFGGEGSDTLSGGIGADVLDGGPGSDVYSLTNADNTEDEIIFGFDSGKDTIVRSDTPYGAWAPKIVRLESNVRPEDLKLAYLSLIPAPDSYGTPVNGFSGTLTLGIQGSTATLGGLIVGRTAAGEPTVPTSLVFADGTTWSGTDIFSHLAMPSPSAGSDVFAGGSASDTWYGLGGIDIAAGGNGADTLDGGDGNDTLYGGSGDDILQGGAGADTLYGDGGYNILDGGPGDDRLNGGSVYRFSGAWGTDTISWIGANASLEFDASVSPSALQVAVSGSSLILSIPGTSNKVTVQGAVASDAQGDQGQYLLLGQIRFADGTVWSGADVFARLLTPTSLNDSLVGTTLDDRLDGGSGSDTLMGASGNDWLTGGAGDDAVMGGVGADRLDGGSGNDVLSGGVGDDLYVFGRGAGQDTITDVGGVDTVQFGPDITPADIVVTRIDSTITLSISGTQDALTIAVGGNGYVGVERIRFADGTVMNPYTWIAQDDQITLAPGDGQSIVGATRYHDTLAFAAGVSVDDVTVSRSGMDLVVELSNGADGMVFSNWFQSAASPTVLQARFSDGTVWSADDLSRKALTVIGGEGDDLLTGLAMFSNVLRGDNGNDHLVGGNAADVLDGGSGNDRLDGGNGDDRLAGGSGDDTYYVDSVADSVVELPGEGIDTVRSGVSLTLSDNLENLELIGWAAANGTGNAQDNRLTGNMAANTLVGAQGSDILDGGAGADTMVGGAGDDTYYVDNAADTITEVSGEGNDIVCSSITYTLADSLENLTLMGQAAINGTGNAGANRLVGNEATNRLVGLAGNDTLDGGAGADVLVGGAGDDTYYVDSPLDTVTENANEGGDTVRSTVSYTLSSNVENLALSGNAAIDGTGNTLANRITGNSAKNVLSGGSGNDILEGKAGNDTLQGGQGADSYLFGIGAGQDVIIESADVAGVLDRITFDAGINAADLMLRWNGNDLVVSLKGSADRITVRNFKLAGGAIEEIRFFDGSTLNSAQILAAANSAAADTAPTLATPLPDLIGSAGQLFEMSAGAAFADADSGDALAFSATLVDGSPLPAWLTMNTSTGQLSGTPSIGDMGVYSIKVTASDSGNLSASDVFSVTIGHEQDTSPVVSHFADDASATEHQPFSFALPANMFFDADPGDALILSARLSDGTGLPAWLTFNAATATFSGTPPTGAAGDFAVAVTATDKHGRYVTDSFLLSVASVNDAPRVKSLVPDLILQQGDSVNMVLPSGLVTDPDGDPLTLSVTLADGSPLPSWLSFEPATGVLSGKAASNTVGVTSLKVTATDPLGLSTSDVFDIAVADVNDAPMVAAPLPDMNIVEGQTFHFTIPSTTFVDPDRGDVLSYGIQVISAPAHSRTGIGFNASTREIFGASQFGLWDVGTWKIQVTSRDRLGAIASDTFDLNVEASGVNHAPVIATSISPWSEVRLDYQKVTRIVQATSGQIVVPVTLTTPTENAAEYMGLRFLDLDAGDSLTYSVAPTTAGVQNWTYNQSTGNLSYAYSGGQRSTSWTVTATDRGGLSVSYAMTVLVNSSPVPSSVPDIIIDEDATSTFTLPPNVFVDPDGDALSIVGSSLSENYSGTSRNWATYNSSTQTYTFTPHDGSVGTFYLDLAATDSYKLGESYFGTSGSSVGSATTRIKVTVRNTYDPPKLKSAIPDVTVTEDQSLRLYADQYFSELDPGETLTYSATMSNGAPLPDWLSINASTGQISGIPRTSNVGSASITVTATDRFGASVSDSFNLDVKLAARNHAPILVTEAADQIYRGGQSFNFQLPVGMFQDIDVGDTLTYRATLSNGAALPSWLTFNIATRTFSGTLPANQLLPTQIKVIARDSSGAETSDGFSIAVDVADQPPMVVHPLGTQTAIEDVPFTVTIPTDAVVDPDSLLAPALSATLIDGGALPAWLTFNPATRTFSGTPTNGDVGEIQVKLTALDADGLSADDIFLLVVKNTNDAPVVASILPSVVQAREHQALNFVVPATAFQDIDAGDSLTLSAGLSSGASLPSWLTFDAANGAFSGTPPAGQAGMYDLRVVATDIAGEKAFQTFSLTVENANDAPEVGEVIPNQEAMEDAVFSFALPSGTFHDIDVGDVITLGASCADGAPLPSWLNFNAATGMFSGTPTNDDVGAITIRVTAADAAGLSANQQFVLDVLNVNDAPVINTPVISLEATQDIQFFTAIPVDSFLDVDAGDVLAYSAILVDGSPLPNWLNFDPVARTFSGIPSNGDVGIVDIRLIVTDKAGEPAYQDFRLQILNVNDVPVATGSLTTQDATQDQPFEFIVPQGTFADPDVGDVLTYTATLRDGTPLPSWLHFDPVTVSFSGTPSNSDVGAVSVQLVATDMAGGSISQQFSVNVQNVNDLPIVSAIVEDQRAVEDTFFSFSLSSFTFTDIDPLDSLSLSASLADGSQLPNWLSFDAVSGVFSGTPANGDVGIVSVRVTAMDLAGATASQIFGITIANVNDQPVSGASIGDCAAIEDTRFDFTVPSDAFFDVDVGDSLILTATLANGQALPSWLAFDQATGSFSGNPTNNDVGDISVRVTATDIAGASAVQVFGICVANVNDAPVSGSFIGDQLAVQDAAFTFAIPGNTFADIDVGDSLSFSATQANGEPLPSWLAFSSATGVFSGTPANGDVGDLAIRITATDSVGASVSQTFTLNVTNVNDAPVAAIPLSAQVAHEDSSVAFTLPAGAFTDPDAGDSLSYSASLANSNPLPSWLHFDPATGTFSGTPGNSDAGTVSVWITATDLAGASASSTFSLEVQNVNDAPVAAGDIATTAEDTPLVLASATLLANDHDIDPTGDVLTLSTVGNAQHGSVTLGANGAITFTPTANYHGSASFDYTVTDGQGGQTTTTVAVNVTPINDAPVINVALAPPGATEDIAYSYTLPANAFTDEDGGDSLTLSATLADGNVLPSWLTFNAATGTFSGTPGNSDVGTMAIRMTATDTAGASASQSFDLAVANVNDAPMVGTPLANQSVATGTVFSFTLPASDFSDVDAGDHLSFSATQANGSALPAWVQFDSITQTFSGTSGTAGSYQFTVTATDLAGASASQDFSLDVTSGGTGNAPPVAQADSVCVTEDTAVSVSGNVLSNDTDADGDTLRVANGGSYDGDYGNLFLAANGSYFYLLDNPSNTVQALSEGQTVVEHFSYQADDGIDTTAGSLTVTVTGKNDIPVLVTPLADRKLGKNTDFSWKLPAGTFIDVDASDTLSYSAKLANGGSLPTWLKFDAATQTFSGHAPRNANGVLDVKVSVSDGHGASSVASDVFRISFAQGNDHDDCGWGDDGHTPPKAEHNDTGGCHHGESGQDSKYQNAVEDLLDWFAKVNEQYRHATLDSHHFDPHHQDHGNDRDQEFHGNDQDARNLAHWLATDMAVARFLADESQNLPWLHRGHGDDIHGHDRDRGGFLGCNRAWGNDPINLVAGGALKDFKGLQEGVRHLG